MPKHLLVLALLAACSPAANQPRYAFSFPFAAPDSYASAAYAAVDAQGNAYLTGAVVGEPFTATPGALQPHNAGGPVSCVANAGFHGPTPFPCRNTFVIKLDPAGQVVFATYLGGEHGAVPTAIAVDAQGAVYVAGTVGAANSGTDFPVTPGAAFRSFSPYFAGSFIAKLDPSGTALQYSTLMPSTQVASLAIDPAGNAYFGGTWTRPGLFPVTPGAYETSAVNAYAGVLGKLNASGSTLLWGSYFDGPGTGTGTAMSAIALDASGNVVVAGSVVGSNTLGEIDTIFTARLTPDGSTLLSSALFRNGGVHSMKQDARGDLYLLCAPLSNSSSFLLHLAADGATILASTDVPFTVDQGGAAFDVDPQGNSYLLGAGPVTTTLGAFRPSSPNPAADVVIAKITPNGQFAGATYLGARPSNLAKAIAVESDGSVVVAGLMGNVDFVNASGGNLFLTANVFPAITVENSASFVAGSVVPGELVSIQGYGIGPDAGVVSDPVASLAGVQVYFNNLLAPATYVQNHQINVQAPWELAGASSAEIRILYNGVEAGRTTVPVLPGHPGIFSVANADGTINSSSNPARPGSFISVYGTGGGPATLAGVTGGAWPRDSAGNLTLHVSAALGSQDLSVLYAGTAPTLNSGFFQINLRLPPSDSGGPSALVVSIGGVASSPIPLAW